MKDDRTDAVTFRIREKTNLISLVSSLDWGYFGTLQKDITVILGHEDISGYDGDGCTRMSY